MSLIETAKELRRQADLIESIAAKPEADPLDIAYLAIGAAQQWEKYRESFDDIGRQEVIETVIDFADNLLRMCAKVGSRHHGYGVWCYDVSEPLGRWIVEQWAMRGHCPSSAEVDQHIADVITWSRGVRA